MKTRVLIIIGSIFIISVLLYIFIMSTTGQCGFPLTSCTNFDESNVTELKQIQRVLDYCHTNDLMNRGEFESKNGTIFVLDAIGYYFFNDTHYIDNNSCEWRLLENYPNSDDLCIPGQYVEDNENRIKNGTHIYNNYTCMWEILEICTGYCGKIENEK